MVNVRRVAVVVAGWGAVAALAVGICACGTGRKNEPLQGFSPEPGTPRLQAGRAEFMRNCQECHPNGAAGVGPALNNKPLPGAAIKLQVRAGAGKMPAFSKEKVSDEEVGEIVDYLVWLRRR